MPTCPRSAAERRVDPLAVVLGTDEVASAVAIRLIRSGHGVVMCHDPDRPVIRRGMSFHDVLWGEMVTLDGVAGVPLESAYELRLGDVAASAVRVSSLGLVDLLPVGPFDVLVDARHGGGSVVPDLRNLAGLAIGIGPFFRSGINCDVAITACPASDLAPPAGRSTGRLPRTRTGDPHRIRAETSGRWHTSLVPGVRVYRGMVLGHLGRTPVTTPQDGMLRGIARDGIEVPEGAEIVEVDTRNRWRARWTGVDDGAAEIADAATRALALHLCVAGTSH